MFKFALHIKFFLSSIILFFGLFSSSFAQNHRLVISIHGTIKSKGKLIVALYRAHDNFSSSKTSFRHQSVHTHQGTTQVVFEDLPADKYAIAAYLDDNNNGKMDKNFFGAPTELYGFSNDARELMQAPSFQKAAFHLNKDLKINFFIK
jgi:uncharacterized protein (DUF2141 family)